MNNLPDTAEEAAAQWAHPALLKIWAIVMMPAYEQGEPVLHGQEIGENLKGDLTIGAYRYIVTPMEEKSAMDKRYPFWLPKELYQQAQKKSGLIPLAAVIRTLLAMWLRGEIELKTQERKEG